MGKEENPFVGPGTLKQVPHTEPWAALLRDTVAKCRCWFGLKRESNVSALSVHTMLFNLCLQRLAAVKRWNGVGRVSSSIRSVGCSELRVAFHHQTWQQHNLLISKDLVMEKLPTGPNVPTVFTVYSRETPGVK